MRTRLGFTELLALHIVRQENGVRITELTGKINAFIRDNNVPPKYAMPLGRGMARVFGVLKKLREAGMITSWHPAITEKGEEYLERIGADWREWPVEIEFENGTIVKEKYVPGRKK